jgi:T-complex protein 1 subunit delta
VVRKLGGTVDDTEMVDGLVFTQKASKSAGGPTRIQKAKIAVIQFQLSPPKTDIENTVVISDYQQMDRVLKEERNYIANLCKKIAQTKCNVILLQKSILRDAITDLGLHFLSKLKIMLVRDVERDEIEFVCKTLGCVPIASPDGLREDKLGTADLVEEVPTSDGKIVKITGCPKPMKTVSILCRGSNKLVLEENERSLHDALCVVRSLFKKRYMIPGGSCPEMEVSNQLMEYSKTLSGVDSYCVRAYAEALEIIPATLAENAGLNPINIVTELRIRHAKGEKHAGINVRKGTISDMLAENVVQPLLVSTSALELATECVRMILKIDGVVPTL